MPCTTVSRRENFTWNDEGGRVRTKILEEVSEAVQDHEYSLVAVIDHLVVSKAHAAEYGGQCDKSHVLDRLATPLRDK